MLRKMLAIQENDKVELNEFGNVSKVERTETFSDDPSNFSKTFHYRIEKEAGLSVDEETGEMFPVYSKIEIKYENEMKEDTLQFAHEIYYKNEISKENEIDLKHITPISKEQYEEEMNS